MKGNLSGEEVGLHCHVKSMLMIPSRNCLKNGASCGYPAPASELPGPSTNTSFDPRTFLSSNTPINTLTTPTLNVLQPQQSLEPILASSESGTEALLWHSNMDQPCFSTILPATRTDPFNTLPFDLSHESKMLLDHCESTLNNAP